METNLLKQLDVIEGDTIYPVYIYDEGAHNKISNINSEITNIHSDIDSVENSITGITGDISHLDDELTALENSTTSAINSVNNNIGNLANLDTESKINLVSAINEVLNSQSDLGYINVKDYGATGDGITDDYTAFVNAIANTPIHGTLFIPMGLYSLSTSINITKPIRILGAYSGWDVWDSNSDVTVTQMKQPLIKSNSTTWAINVKCLGFTMENISIEIVNANNTDGCLRISNENSTVEKFNRFNLIVNSSVINNVNQSGTGISIDYSGLTELNRVTTYGFNFGIMCTQLDSTRKTNTSVIMINCWCMNYWNTGYTLTDCHYCTLIGCASDTINENQNGYNLINCFGTSLINCGAEKNKYGFIIDGCYNVSVSGECQSLSNANCAILIRNGGSVHIDNFYAGKSNVGNTYRDVREVQGVAYTLYTNTNISSIYYIDHDVTISNGAFFATNKSLEVIE